MSSTVWAQRAGPLPKGLEGVGVTEHLEAQIPLDLTFVDERGKRVKLKTLFDGKRPVVLTMNYSNCPMLCSLQLNGLFKVLGKMEWDIGDQFQMITVSIDPMEMTERSKMTKQKYLKLYRRAGADQGYHCLTGREEDIKKLAKVVGFGYKYSPESRQYIHAAVTFILTPDGKVSRYLYGVEYDPQTVRLSLVDAANGKIGSTVDRFLLFCFHYDPTTGRYGPAAFRMMQIGCGLTVLMLGTTLWAFRRREKKKTRAKTAEETP